MPLGRRVLLGALLAAMVLAQALGLVHRIVHLPAAAGAGVPALHAHGGHAHQADAHEGLLSGLFGGHSDDSTCRLFDAMGHDGAPAMVAFAAPVLAALFFLDLLHGDFVARWAALFDARGPPPLR